MKQMWKKWGVLSGVGGAWSGVLWGLIADIYAVQPYRPEAWESWSLELG